MNKILFIVILFLSSFANSENTSRHSVLTSSSRHPGLDPGSSPRSTIMSSPTTIGDLMKCQNVLDNSGHVLQYLNVHEIPAFAGMTSRGRNNPFCHPGLTQAVISNPNPSRHPELDPGSSPSYLKSSTALDSRFRGNDNGERGNENEGREIKAISEYLKSLKSMSANFMQTDKRGNEQTGQFYLSRPSKMRWEYKSPKELIIIMNGERVYYYDKELDQFSHYIGEKGLIGLFGEDDMFASKYVDLLDLRINSGNIEVTFQKKADAGKITLVFATNPLQILGFVIHEEPASKIKIKFNSIINDVLLDNSLFTFSHSIAPKSR